MRCRRRQWQPMIPTRFWRFRCGTHPRRCGRFARRVLILTSHLHRAWTPARPRTIVVLENGDPVLMPWLGSVKAVLETWYPGARGGEAIANILFGDVNPSGKLVLSFPRSEADFPRPVLQGPPPPPAGTKPDPDIQKRDAFFDVNYSEGMKVGYRWYDAENKEPLFPFGFGLSYSSFAYAKLRV